MAIGGKLTAMLKCGGTCSQTFAISGHAIDDAGVVTPSVVCPIEGCKWHVQIVLEGWGS